MVIYILMKWYKEPKALQIINNSYKCLNNSYRKLKAVAVKHRLFYLI